MLACWECHISGVIDFIPPPKFLLQAACMSCWLLFSQGTNVHTYHHKYDTTYCMSGDSVGNWMQSNRVIWSISQGWRISVWCFERLHARSVQIVELGMWGDNLMYIIVNRQWFPISYITRIHIPYSLFFRLWRNTTKPRLLVNEITASEKNNSNSPRPENNQFFKEELQYNPPSASPYIGCWDIDGWPLVLLKSAVNASIMQRDKKGLSFRV